MKKIALIIFFLAISALAEERVFADDVNIPLPRQGAYTGRGLSAGLAGGVFEPTKNCDCLGVWQAQGDFLYYPWLSGGIDVRFFGGDLDSDVMVMYQRYRISAKAFFLTKILALYLSPVLGLENTSISEFRKELHGHGSRVVERRVIGRCGTDGETSCRHSQGRNANAACTEC